ncbi:hypothetical protein MHIB_18060 [Mycolicibacter hiberniae]|uniref:Uncharacterized protein n=1 Tax=Mycolicibacter hiberniae TaxID=29314 RepID=A0A7I7X516_9MYCO|nr:hypothetical protein MHIB_18060 [Mycolicibacter hiberniae]
MPRPPPPEEVVLVSIRIPSLKVIARSVGLSVGPAAADRWGTLALHTGARPQGCFGGLDRANPTLWLSESSVV